MMKEDQIVAAIRSCTVEVFSTMLSLEMEAGVPRNELNPPGPSDGIVALIGLAGAWIGTGSLACDVPMALRMASSMLEMECTEIDDDVLDAISEIANMIFGNFKTIAETHLGPLGLSIPTVVYGMRFSARTAGKEKWVVLPFLRGDDIVELKICLTPNRGLPHMHKH